jgi:FkbM family methyltransferase
MYNNAMSILSPWYIYRPDILIASAMRRIHMPKQFVVKTSFGSSMLVNREDAIARAIALNGIYELATSETIVRIIRAGARQLVDVGANIGYMTLLMHAHLKAFGHAEIQSFEPHPLLFQKLLNNIVLNPSTDRIRTYNCALSDKDGTADLYIPQGFSSNNGIASLEKDNSLIKVAVKTSRLDTILSQPIDLMKIDVEGHELAVLEGASSALSRKRIKSIIFEDHSWQNSLVIETLLDAGFQVRSISHTYTGLRLQDLNQVSIRENEAPNFLATLDDSVIEMLNKSEGWLCLKRQKN